MRGLHGLVAFAALLLVPPAASAQGCAEFSISPAELQLAYDPYTTRRVDRIFNLRVRRLDERATSVRILFADPDPVAAAPVVGIGGPANYDIEWVRDAGRQILALGAEQPNATNGALIGFGRARGSPARSEAFRIRVPAGQDVAAGTYFQPLDVRFQCFAGDEPLGPPGLQTDGRVALDLRVEESVRAFVGAPGMQRATIDFGSLTPGLGNVSRSLSLTAQSTVSYEVGVQAENGALVRGRRDGAKIDYAMWLSDLPVKDGSRLACPRTRAPRGRTHLLRAEVDGADAAKAPAGDYRDVVTLTFSPRIGLDGGDACAVNVP